MNESKKIKTKGHEKFIPLPDPEILSSTDPQEYMKGILSSAMHRISEEAKKNDRVSKEEATHKRDEHL